MRRTRVSTCMKSASNAHFYRTRLATQQIFSTATPVYLFTSIEQMSRKRCMLLCILIGWSVAADQFLLVMAVHKGKETYRRIHFNLSCLALSKQQIEFLWPTASSIWRSLPTAHWYVYFASCLENSTRAKLSR